MSTPRMVIFYRNPTTGKEPVKDWIENLRDETGRARILVQIFRVRCGNFGNSKSLGEGLFELKMAFGPGYRIYYALEGEDVILLLSAGDKSSQHKDIERAREYLTEHKRRNRYGKGN